MRIVCLLLAGTLLLVRAGGAGAAAPLGYDAARHLLTRTGFGATDGEIRTFAALTRDQAVARLLDGGRSAAVTPVPATLTELVRPQRVK